MLDCRRSYVSVGSQPIVDTLCQKLNFNSARGSYTSYHVALGITIDLYATRGVRSTVMFDRFGNIYHCFLPIVGSLPHSGVSAHDFSFEIHDKQSYLRLYDDFLIFGIVPKVKILTRGRTSRFPWATERIVGTFRQVAPQLRVLSDRGYFDVLRDVEYCHSLTYGRSFPMGLLRKDKADHLRRFCNVAYSSDTPGVIVIGYRTPFGVPFVRQGHRLIQRDDDDGHCAYDVKQHVKLKRERDLRERPIRNVSPSTVEAYVTGLRRRGRPIVRAALSAVLTSSSGQVFYEAQCLICPKPWREALRGICLDKEMYQLLRSRLEQMSLEWRRSEGSSHSTSKQGGVSNPRGFVPDEQFLSHVTNGVPALKAFVELARVVDRLLLKLELVTAETTLATLRVLLHLVQFGRSCTQLDVVGAGLSLTQICLLPYISSHLKELVSKIFDYVSKVGTESLAVRQSGGEEKPGDDEGKKRKGIFSAVIFRSLFKFLAEFFSSSLFHNLPSTVRTKMYEAWQTGGKVVDEISMFESLLDLVKDLIDRASEFSRTGNVWCLFAKDRHHALLVAIETTLERLNGTDRSTVMLSDPSFYHQARKLSDKSVQSLGDPSIKKNPVLVKAIIDLRSTLSDFEKGRSTSRKAPFGLIISGEPGVGKTHMVNALEDQVRAKFGVPADTTVTMTYQPDASHQTQPSMSLIVLLNDAFQTKDEKSNVPYLSLLQTLVDTTTVKLEGASLEEKERSLISPEIVVVTTNVSKYLMSTATGGANKLDRRYFRLHVVWTLSARLLAQKHGIMPSKLHEHFPERKDLCNYEVGTMCNDPKDGNNELDLTISKVLLQTSDFDEVNRFFFDEMQRQESTYRAQKARVADLCQHGLQNPCRCVVLGKDYWSERKEPAEEQVFPASLDSLRAMLPKGFSVLGFDSLAKDMSDSVKREGSAGSKPVSVFGPPVIEGEECHDLVLQTNGSEQRTRAILQRISNLTGIPASHFVVSNEGYIYICKDLGDVSGALEGEHVDLYPYFFVVNQLEQKIVKFSLDGKALSIVEEAEPVGFVDIFWDKWCRLDLPVRQAIFNTCSFLVGFVLPIVIVARLAVKDTVVRQGNLHGKILGVENVNSIQEKLAGALPPWLYSSGKKPPVLDTTVLLEGHRGNMYANFVSLEVILVPKHFFRKGPGSSHGRDYRNGDNFSVAGQSFVYCEERLYAFGTLDIVSYYVGPVVGAWSSIWQLLPEKRCAGGEILATMKGQAVTLTKFGGELEYRPCVTVDGDCGTPLFRGGEIIGLHVASCVGILGLAVTISKEMVEESFVYFRSHGLFPAQMDDVRPQGYPTLVDCDSVRTDGKWCRELSTPEQNFRSDCFPLGAIKRCDNVKMSVHETTMHHIFADRCLPYVNPRTGKATYSKLLEKWISPVTRRYDIKGGNPGVDPSFYAKLIAEAVSELPPSSIRCQPLTWYEAFVGVDDNYLMGPKDYSKSVGPLNSLQGRKASNAFRPLEGDEGFEVAPWYVERMTYIEEKLRLGQIPWVLARAALKDELRTQAHQDEYKTRFFYVCEAEVNTGLKKYYKPLISFLVHRSDVTGFKTAINTGSDDWDLLAESLTKFGGKNLFDCDQKEYDMHHDVLIPYVIDYCYAVAKHIGYSDEDCAMVVMYGKLCFRNVLLMEYVFYLTSTKLLSGLDVTSFFNCIFNTLTNRAATRRALDTLGLREERVRDHMFDATCGDDAVIAFSDTVLKVIDGDYLVENASGLGYVLTDSDKTSAAPKLRSIEEVQFLKRRFVRYGNRWLSPLALESIYRSLCYAIATSVSQEERDAGALRCAFKEIWFHGLEVFEEFRQVCLANSLPVMDFASLKEDFDKGRYYVWDPVGVVAQSRPAAAVKRDVLRDKPGLDDQHELYDSHEPRLSLDNQTSYVTELRPERRAEGLLPSTELNTTAVDVAKTSNDPVGDFAVLDMDIEKFTEQVNLAVVERQESLAEFFARPRRVQTFDVNTTSVLTTSIPVFDTWLALPGVNKVMSQYYLWRGNPVVTVVYSGNPSVLGMVRIACWPNFQPDTYGTDPFVFTSPNTQITFPRSGHFPGIDIDLSKPCTCRFKLPFPHQFDFANIDTYDWNLTAHELLGMTSVNTVVSPPSLKFDIFVHYEDMQVKVLVPQSGSSEGKGSWAQFLSGSAAIASLIPYPFANVASQVLAASSAVAGYMGWSRPMLEATETMVMRRHGNPALGGGQCDMVQHMGLTPSTGSNTLYSQYPLGRADDMKLSRFFDNYSHLVRSWTEGSAGAISCNPIYTSLGHAPGTRFYPTALAYGSMLFQYWTGSLKYKVKVYSSPLIRWRIGIVVVPARMAIPLAFPVGGDFVTTIVDVVGTSEVEINVPYQYVQPFQQLTDPLDVTSNYTRLVYFSLCPPSGPSATTATPIVSVWVKGGADFEVSQPTGVFVERYRHAEGKRSAYTFGETFEDWGMLLKRSINYMNISVFPGTGSVGYISVPLDGAVPDGSTVYGPPGGVVSMSSFAWTFSTYLRRCFLGYNGGTIIRIVPEAFTVGFDDSVTVTLGRGFCGSQSRAVNVIGTGTFNGGLIVDRDDFVIEAGCPSRSNSNWKNAQKYDNIDLECPNLLINHNLPGVSVSDTIFYGVWMAAMDDFTMGGFLGPAALLVI